MAFNSLPTRSGCRKSGWGQAHLEAQGNRSPGFLGPGLTKYWLFPGGRLENATQNYSRLGAEMAPASSRLENEETLRN